MLNSESLFHNVNRSSTKLKKNGEKNFIIVSSLISSASSQKELIRLYSRGRTFWTSQKQKGNKQMGWRASTCHSLAYNKRVTEKQNSNSLRRNLQPHIPNQKETIWKNLYVTDDYQITVALFAIFVFLF